MPPSVTCLPHRLEIPELTAKIQEMTKLPPEIIQTILTAENKDIKIKTYNELSGVNHQNDYQRVIKSKLDREAGFTAATSISEAEADRFIYQVQRFWPSIPENDPKKKIAQALDTIYFGGLLFYNPDASFSGLNFTSSAPSKEISLWFFPPFHDSDTGTGATNVPKECKDIRGYWGFYGPIREAGVDAVERGLIPDLEDPKKNEAVIKFVLERYKEFVQMWAQGKFYDLPRKNGPASINEKQVDNSIKVLHELVKDPTSLTAGEMFVSLQLITAWSNYYADLARNVTDGLKDFVQKEKGDNLSGDISAIRFASDLNPMTPKHMCNRPQLFDPYLRLLVGYNASPLHIKDYLEKSFLKDFYNRFYVEREGERGGKYEELKFEYNRIYKDHLELITKLHDRLVSVAKSSNIKAIAEKFGPAKLPTPQDIYNEQDITAIIADLKNLFEKYPKKSNNWDVVKVIAGIDAEYQKYRGSDFPVLEEAGKIAREKKRGAWKLEMPLKLLRDYNMKDPKYWPEDCTAGK